MTVDCDEALKRLRPQTRVGSAAGAAMLDDILSTGQGAVAQPSARRRRVGPLVAAAGLIAAAALIVPAVLPAGSPGAADQASATQALHHLAHIAAITAVSPTDHLGPGQYLHVVDVDHQTALAGQPGSDSRYESWIRADGVTWQLRDETWAAGTSSDWPVQPEEVWLVPSGDRDPDYPSPSYLRELPTEPVALDAYLRAHTTGSTSADERVFVAVGAIVGRGMAQPALRSAAIEVLAGLGRVELGTATHDSQGNPVQEFDFVDPDKRPNDITAYLFDTRTAQITEQREYFHGELHFRSVITRFDVVDSVPADIRDRAIVQR